MPSKIKGSVTVWIAVVMPALILCVALPIEVGNWAVQKIDMQRDCDLAAMAGMVKYRSLFNQKEQPSEKASHSIDLAQAMIAINGQSGTAQMVSGLAEGGTAITVTVSRVVPFILISGRDSVTLTANATAELIGPEPGPDILKDDRPIGIVR